PCTDFLVPDLSHYYETLGSLAKGASDSGKLLERYALGFTSPVEAGPAAMVIAQSKVSDDQFKALVDGYSKTLAKISGDDRSFTASFMLGPAIQALAGESKRRGIPALPLIESYRVYLIIHLSAARCADNDLMYAAGTPFGMSMPQPAELSAVNPASFFNE